MVLRYREYLD